MTRYLIALALALLAGYGAYEAYPLLAGPALTLDSPEDGAQVSSGIAVVSGTVGRAVSLTLDGAPLLPEQDGSFSSTLAFATGTSILTLTAADRFGRTVTKTRTIYVP